MARITKAAGSGATAAADDDVRGCRPGRCRRGVIVLLPAPPRSAFLYQRQFLSVLSTLLASAAFLNNGLSTLQPAPLGAEGEQARRVRAPQVQNFLDLDGHRLVGAVARREGVVRGRTLVGAAAHRDDQLGGGRVLAASLDGERFRVDAAFLRAHASRLPRRRRCEAKEGYERRRPQNATAATASVKATEICRLVWRSMSMKN